MANGERRLAPAHETPIEWWCLAVLPPRRSSMSTSIARGDSRWHIMQNAHFGQDDQEVSDTADEGEHEDANKDHGRVGLALAKHEQIAQTQIAADQFADDNT